MELKQVNLKISEEHKKILDILRATEGKNNQSEYIMFLLEKEYKIKFPNNNE